MSIRKLIHILVLTCVICVYVSPVVAQDKKIKRVKSTEETKFSQPRRDKSEKTQTKNGQSRPLKPEDKARKPVSSVVGTVFIDDSMEYIVVEGVVPSCYLRKGSTHRSNVQIPSVVRNYDDGVDYRVIGIGDRAFDESENLRCAVIPNTVSHIGDWAFYSCVNLREVTIPDSVTSIGESAFHSCTSLVSIVIPVSVTSIKDLTFWNCPRLMEVSLPPTLKSIGKNAFSHCTSLKEIVIPAGVSFSKENTFKGCRNDLKIIEK